MYGLKWVVNNYLCSLVCFISLSLLIRHPVENAWNNIFLHRVRGSYTKPSWVAFSFYMSRNMSFLLGPKMVLSLLFSSFATWKYLPHSQRRPIKNPYITFMLWLLISIQGVPKKFDIYQKGQESGFNEIISSYWYQ